MEGSQHFDIPPSQPMTWIRQVPGVKDVYGIKFERLEAEYIVVRCYGRDGKQLKELCSVNENSFGLLEFYQLCRDRYREEHPEKLLFSEYDPKVVIQNRDVANSPTNWTMVLLGEGLVVAYSQHFVAHFNRTYGRWFVYGIAMEPGKYLPVNAGPGRKLAGDLDWDGNGLKYVELFVKNAAAAMPPMIPQQLLVPRAADPMEGFQIRMLWIGQESNLVHAESGNHVFRFTERHGDFTWEVYHCGDTRDVTTCHVYNMEMEVKYAGRIMEVKDFDKDWF